MILTILDTINLSVIANRSNNELTNYSPIHQGEANVMKDFQNCLHYKKDIATDAEMLYTKNVFIFKGTDSNTDWSFNVNALPVSYEGMYIHRGFLEQFKALLPTIYDNIDITEPVYFIGQSLGGAIAQIAGFHFTNKDYRCIVNTFGAPRSGLKPLKEFYKKRNIESNAYICKGDIVPMLLKRPFYHPEQNIYLVTGNEILLAKNNYLKYLFYRLNFVSRIAACVSDGMDPSVKHSVVRYRNLLSNLLTRNH